MGPRFNGQEYMGNWGDFNPTYRGELTPLVTGRGPPCKCPGKKKNEKPLDYENLYEDRSCSVQILFLS